MLAKRTPGSAGVEFLERVKLITLMDLDKNHSKDLLLTNTVEELGEYAAAKTIEEGYKKKELKEDAKTEALDLVICALSLYYAEGGTRQELETIGHKKLDKWEARV